MEGTIKSSKCKQLLLNGSSQCSEYKNLPQNDAFMKKVIRSLEKTNESNKNKTQNIAFGKKNNQHHKTSEKIKKLESYRALVKKQQRKIFNFKLQIARSKSTKQKISEKISSMAKRGDVSVICYNLNRAY